MEYLSNQQEYPLFGNESYSGVSLVLKNLLKIYVQSFERIH